MLAEIAGVPTLVEAAAGLALGRGVAFPLAEFRILLVVALRCRQHLCLALVRQSVFGVYRGKCRFKFKGNFERNIVEHYWRVIPSMRSSSVLPLSVLAVMKRAQPQNARSNTFIIWQVSRQL